MKRPYIDDSDITEIIIQPDGRIYVFGLSQEVSAVLAEIRQKGLCTCETGPESALDRLRQSEGLEFDQRGVVHDED